MQAYPQTSLWTLFVILTLVRPAAAQFQAPAYHFPDGPMTAQLQPVGDMSEDFTLVDEAANGYGQWVVPGKPAMWELMRRTYSDVEPFDTSLVDDSAWCQQLAHIMDKFSGGPYQTAYDTGRYYLLMCPDLQDPGFTFVAVTGYNSMRSNDVGRYAEYREWLKSVLYYRDNDYWYCGDASSLLGTMYAMPQRGDGIDPGAEIAIARYLLSTGRCRRDSAFLAQTIEGDRKYQIMIWRDTVRDSIHYPNPDTTVPTLEEIGLGLLRAKEAVPTELAYGPKLTDVHATRNPFDNESAIEFTTGEYTLVKIEIFDVIGRTVGGNSIGQVFDPGTHRYELSGADLAPGTYYARLSCLSGEHVTLKLLHN